MTDSKLAPGDYVQFTWRGRTIVARVDSLHPEEGRRYVTVYRLTKNGRASKAERNMMFLPWDLAQTLTRYRKD